MTLPIAPLFSIIVICDVLILHTNKMYNVVMRCWEREIARV